MVIGFVQERSIVSTSMQPTLVQGEAHSFVNRRFFGVVGPSWQAQPERGDIVLVHVEGSAAEFVERIIGLPGETVQMQAGRLYIDGAIVQRKSLGTAEDLDPVGAPMSVNRYREYLPGAEPHVIQEIDDSQVLDDTAAFVVPADHYFVMGDNRDNSMDSRVSDMVGFIPRRDVIARMAAPASGDAL